MVHYPQVLAQDAVWQSRTGHMTGLWFLPARPLRLNTNEWQRSPTTSTRRLSARIGVSRTRVWRTLHEDSLYPFHPQPVQNLHPGDSAMLLQFCHWLHTTHQLLPLILFSDETTFTCNGINSTRNSHRWSHENPHGTVEKKFQRFFFLSMCGAVWSMTCWLVPLF